MIRALEEPCWVAGEEDGRHYGTENEALDAADGTDVPLEEVRQLAHPCLVAECDGDGCGEMFGDDEYAVTHFGANAGDMESYLGGWEWTVADGKVYCHLEPESGASDD